MPPCPFCARAPEGDELAYAFPDLYPSNIGHTLVVPRLHESRIGALPPNVRAAMIDKVDTTLQQLTRQYQPDGFNVGINDGVAAGQTVPHAHVHIIPRYEGDTIDPRGGIRWVLPVTADYWTL